MIVGPETDILKGCFIFGLRDLYLRVALELFAPGEDDPVGIEDSCCVVSVCLYPCRCECKMPG